MTSGVPALYVAAVVEERFSDAEDPRGFRIAHRFRLLGADPELVRLFEVFEEGARVNDLAAADDLEAALARGGVQAGALRATVQLFRGLIIGQRDPRQARAAVERAVEMAREDGDHTAGFTALLSLASLAAGERRTEDAMQLAAAAEHELSLVDWSLLPIVAEERAAMRKMAEAQVDWLRGVALTRSDEPDFGLARYLLRRSLMAVRGTEFEFEVRMALADTESQGGDQRTAAVLLRRARHITRDPQQRGEASVRLAYALSTLGQLDQAMAILVGSPDEGTAAHRAMRNGLLAALRLQDNVRDDQVGAVLVAAKILAPTSPLDTALLRVIAAEALAAAGRPRQARIHADEGWRVLDERGRAMGLGARIRCASAGANLALGRIGEAEAHAEEARRIAHALEDEWEREVEAVELLARAYGAQARFGDSRALWAGIRRRAVERDDPEVLGAALLGMSGAYLSLGDADQAWALWSQALDLVVGRFDGAVSHGFVVELFEHQPGGPTEAAIDNLVEAADFARSAGLETLELRARLLLVSAVTDAGDLDRGEAEARALVALSDPRRRPHDAASAMHLLVGLMEELGQEVPSELLDRFEQAAARSGDAWLQLDAYVRQGERALREGQPDVAQERLRRAAAIAKDSMATNISARHATRQSDVLHEVHVLLAVAHHRAGNAREALEALELGRARLALHALLTERPEDLPDATLREERRLHAERAYLYRGLAEARLGEDPDLIDTLELGLAELAAAIDDLDDRRSDRALARAALSRPDAVHVGDLQAALDEIDAVALEYAVWTGGVLVVAVTSEELWSYERDLSGQELSEMVHALREGLLDLDPDPPHVHELFDLLVAEGLPTLESARLVVIPDGALHALPFDVLQVTPAAAGTPWSQRDLLIDRIAVSRAPSLRVACLLEERGAHRGLARWSGVAAPGGDDRPLPAVQHEVEAIETLLGPAIADPARILIGPAATPTAVRRVSAVSADVLHLACHATAHDDDPELSAVQLSPPAAGPEEEGMWRAHEIAQHRTGHRVVILSACETGVGPVSAEGVLALSRAFLNAGATSVIASLWPVADDTTAQLMPVLHQQLLGGASPGAALRATQLAALDARGSAHPSGWAAFCVTGAA